MRKADDLPPSCAVVTKSRNLTFLEPSGLVQACKGTALPLPLPLLIIQVCILLELLGDGIAKVVAIRNCCKC